MFATVPPMRHRLTAWHGHFAAMGVLAVLASALIGVACGGGTPRDADRAVTVAPPQGETELAEQADGQRVESGERQAAEQAEEEPVEQSGDSATMEGEEPDSAQTPAPVRSDLTVDCTVDAEQSRISCEAAGFQQDSQLTWTSTAAYSSGGGGRWQFIIDDELVAPSAEVFLEECRDASCRTIETLIDLSVLISDEGSLPPSSRDPDFRMRLPFTDEHEPQGLMPMGETIEHPPPKSPYGHPGIDFQWDYKAPVVAVVDGEIAEIIESVHLETGIFNYSVSVITGEFIVNYTTLESMGPDIKVGRQIVTGQLVGFPTSVQQGHQRRMIHWDFGTYEKVEPRADPEGRISEYEVNRLCPVPYFTESERGRLFRIWETVFYGAKDQFPDVCNGYWKNY